MNKFFEMSLSNIKVNDSLVTSVDNELIANNIKFMIK